MLIYLAWALAGLTALLCGWMASAWFHQRRIDALHLQLKVLRQTYTANTDQARRQIGLLQAELASRPKLEPPEPAAWEAPAAPTPLVEGFARRRGVAADRFVVLEDGFPQTAVVGDDAFRPTELQR